MAEADEHKDQSMEEILQSIKRIISDDDTVEGGEEQTTSATAVSEDAEDSTVKGSDVLELKDMVEQGVKEQTSGDSDVLDAIDNSLEHTDQQQAQPPTSTQTGKDGEDQDVLSEIDSLLSNETLQSSSQALSALKQQANAESEQPANPDAFPVTFRSGTTLEELVMEALRPELKRWLNANLPGIVEKLVAAEIKKITGQ